MSQQVLVPHEFFKKSKKEYNNWVQAFFREIIQNSVDAGAKNIDFTLTEDNENLYFSALDNGSGMSRDILENVLLCMGGSHKTNETAIGGFGYAKTLLFFAHLSYSIKTKGWHVKGSGGSYDIFQCDDSPKKGTFIELIIAKNDDIHRRLSVYRFENEFESLIQFSNLPKIKFSFNEKEYKTGNMKMDYQYPTDIGTLSFSDTNNSETLSYLYVRINGLVMFSNYIFTTDRHFIGFIELDKSPTEVLTSNRDSLKGDYKTELSKVMETLSKERSSLISQQLVNITLNPSNLIKEEVESYTYEEEQENLNNMMSFSEKAFPEKTNSDQNAPLPHMKGSEVFGLNKTIQQKIRQKDSQIELINDSFFPQNFKIKQADSVNITPAQTRKRLNEKLAVRIAHAWRNSVYSVLNCMSHFHFYDEFGNQTDFCGQEGTMYYENRPIYVGFCFDIAQALNFQNSDEIQILLNFDKTKTIHRQQHLTNGKLIDLAIHEITHIFNSNHDEAFCSTEMQIKWSFEDYYSPVSFKSLGRHNIKIL